MDGRLICAALLAALATGCRSSAPEAGQAQQAVDELLEADRAFSSAAADVDMKDGVRAMFAPDVVMPLNSTIVTGADSAAALLGRNPANAGARMQWHPVRGGISADGLHGFTLGYTTVTGADGTTARGKYISYWVKRPDGWRVAVYRRGAAAGAPPEEMMEPALPQRMVRVDSSRIAAYRASLDSAERRFSTEAQQVGLAQAFRKYGAPDAVNMGRGAAFTVSAESIAAGFPDYGPRSPVWWAPERVIVAPSGDLGVTIGYIRDNAAADRSVPFVTIWRRALPTEPWRYIAE